MRGAKGVQPELRAPPRGKNRGNLPATLLTFSDKIAVATKFVPEIKTGFPMIRLTLLLLAGLFATLQIGGRDGGAQRLGLIQAAEDAAELSARQAIPDPVAPAPDAAPVTVAFTPSPRVITPAPPAASAEIAVQADIRYVTGRAVNVRGGPSTRTEVVGKLQRGDAVTVAFVDDTGWARIRVEGDGVDGYMALSFLSEVAP